MKNIALFITVLAISGCSTPFTEYSSYNQSGAVIVERSVNPIVEINPQKVENKSLIQTDEEKGVTTMPIDLNRN
jgi:uncharacterized protein YceK